MLKTLRGKRILVVEDEYHIASDIQTMLGAAGAAVVGPVGSLEKGLALANEADLDGALLDVNLGATMSFPIADRLAARMIPYVLLTGYDVSSLPNPYRGMPHVPKPFALLDLVDKLSRVMEISEPVGFPAFRGVAHAHARLAALADLDEPAHVALAKAIRQAQPLRTRREMAHEGNPLAGPLIMVRGWGARIRLLEDGRRQIMSFLLPGDLINHGRQEEPLAASTVVALKHVEVCPAPPAETSPTLAQAYAMSQALEESYLLAQITRLGRLSAEERLADLFLELLERLTLCRRAVGATFQLPLTQDVLADATGLSCVHLNRTLQLLRRQGDITLKSGLLTVTDPVRLAKQVGRSDTRISLRPAQSPHGAEANRRKIA